MLLALVSGCSVPDDPQYAFRHGDYRSAMAGWSERAAQGDSRAQANLGMLYFLGLGTAKDYQKAFYWYRQAAIAGDADAQRYLGYLYQEGLGVRVDRLLAWGWYNLAASQGQKMAQNAQDNMAGELTPNQTMKARAMIRAILEQADKEK